MLKKLLRMVSFHARDLRSRSRGLADLDELYSAGSLGLAQALQRVDTDSPGFHAYAVLRVKGAMSDYLRGQDVLSRGDRKNARQIGVAADALRLRLGREPLDIEVGVEAGLDPSNVERARWCANRGHDVTLVTTLRPGSDGSPATGHLAMAAGPNAEDTMLLHSNEAMLQRLTGMLDARMRVVLDGYYYRERPLRQIAAQLGVTESRVSQLVKEGLRELRRLAESELEDERNRAD